MSTLKDNAHQRAAAALFDAIRKGRYAPDTRISARALATELGTSITPVREVLLKLEALGAVRAGAAGVPFIPKRSAAEIDQIYSTRITLEGQAAAEAAERINDKTIAVLRRLDTLTSEAQTANNIRTILELNERLHFTIYAASGNETLLDIINLLWLRCGPLLPLVYGFYSVTRQQFSRSEEHTHSELIESLERRDAETTRQLICRDIQSGLSVYRALTIDLETAIIELTRPVFMSDWPAAGLVDTPSSAPPAGSPPATS